MQVYHVPTQLVPEWFEDVRAQIEEACELHPFLDADDVLQLCTAGHAVLTIAVDEKGVACGCFVTEMLTFPKKRAVNILIVGGNRGFLADGFQQVLEQIEREAMSVKADGLCALGRPGWLRVAQRIGWRTRELTSVWKELGDARIERRRQQRDADNPN